MEKEKYGCIKCNKLKQRECSKMVNKDKTIKFMIYSFHLNFRSSSKKCSLKYWYLCTISLSWPWPWRYRNIHKHSQISEIFHWYDKTVSKTRMWSQASLCRNEHGENEVTVSGKFTLGHSLDGTAVTPYKSGAQESCKKPRTTLTSLNNSGFLLTHILCKVSRVNTLPPHTHTLFKSFLK